MKKLFLVSKILLLLILLGVIGAAVGVGWLFYRAMPVYAGNATLPGLASSVHIVHDEHGVPHIFADNMNDAARALGYVHASERLFQMETQRRAGQGRLSEIFGADTLGIDKFLRTLGLYHLAESSVDSLSPEAKEFFQAYADGVNAWLDTHQNALPVEFVLLGVKPDPWKIADSVVWGKLMAFQLSKNYSTEILRAQLAKKLSPTQMEAVFPPTSADAPITIEPGRKVGELKSDVAPAKAGVHFSDNGISKWMPAFAGMTPVSNILNQLSSITGLDHPASNEWVISGSRTVSGKPILANDPHLGLEAPILWYLARIVTPELAIEGATVPGLPIVLLGQNGHVAWGFTTTGSDVQDLFVETIDPAHADSYLTPNGSEPFQARSETIHVKGAQDVVLQVRTTRHGPVLSDIDPEMQKIANASGDCGMVGETVAPTNGPVVPKPCDNRVMALAFTGLDAHDATSEALMRLDRAASSAEFLDALKLYQAPPQNVVYADTSGVIGFINPGHVPIRKSGDGGMPVDGASGAYDWVGLVPFEQLPQISNPEAGYVFNANNIIVGPTFPYFMGKDWEEPWRAERLQQFFDANEKQTLDSSAKMQADHVSLAARALLPYLLHAYSSVTYKHSPQSDAVIDMLKNWDGTMDRNRPEPMIFEAWLYVMHSQLLVMGTGENLKQLGPFDATSIDHILGSHTQDWCQKPDCNDLIMQGFNDALDLIAQRNGLDMKTWRWGHEHMATLHHKFFSHIPILSDWSRLDVPSSGDFYTLDRGGSFDQNPDHPFARTHGGGYRGIYDLGDPAQSRFMITTGESDHIFSRHYGDLVPLWNNVESFTLSGTRDELTARGLSELVMNSR